MPPRLVQSSVPSGGHELGKRLWHWEIRHVLVCCALEMKFRSFAVIAVEHINVYTQDYKMNNDLRSPRVGICIGNFVQSGGSLIPSTGAVVNRFWSEGLVLFGWCHFLHFRILLDDRCYTCCLHGRKFVWISQYRMIDCTGIHFVGSCVSFVWAKYIPRPVVLTAPSNEMHGLQFILSLNQYSFLSPL